MSMPRVSPLESTVEHHIDSTSRLVRQVDLAFALLTVVCLLLGGLFLAILADHWLLKEGLSVPLRLAIFSVLAAGAGFYVYWKIVPILRYRINPIYTADLIEKDVHTFKNSLINWIMLRQEREGWEDKPNSKIQERMFDGIVKTAAANVQTVPTGHAVDLRKLILAGTLFAALLIIFIAYTFLSPKSPIPSLLRTLIPFADIDRPQAAQFRNVAPGDTTALQGESLIISAEVVSSSIEPVYLVFSTDDGQAVEQRIPMALPDGKIAYESQFPPGRQGAERGFNSGVDYWIAQGESRSRPYRIDVLPAASIEIVSLQYDFPAYTGQQSETIEHGGDVRALEGTAVTVAVRSTLPLDKINLVFDNNPANNVSMRIADDAKTEARGTFTLRHPFPHQSYSFQAADAQGHASRRSGIYRIEVIPDQPPKVQWADTAQHLREDRISIPLNETLPFPIQAEDPDFSLRYLRFKSEVPGKRIPDVPFLESPTTGPTAHRGQIVRVYNFSPTEKRLAVGDSVEVWAEAVDTKLPEGNVSTTRRITVNIIEPTHKDQETDPNKEDQKDGNEGDDGQQGDGQQGDGEKGDGEKGDDGSEGQDSGQDNPDQQDTDEGKEGSEGGESQPDEGGPNEGGEEQNGGGQGESGTADEQQPGESAGGGAGDDSADGGDDVQEGNPQNGRGSDEQSTQTPDNQHAGQEQAGQEQGGGEQTGPVNPETQDGDAMERIVEQMKQDGKFDENALNQNQADRTRDDTLDPDSSNRRDSGNDPNNPQESAQPCEGGQCNACSQCSGQQGEGQQGEGQQGEGQQGEGQQGEGQQGEGQQPGTEGGETGNGESMPGEGTGGGSGATRETIADDPNLQHANQVANMVLEYLKDQLQETPSDELLHRLGWTEEQLRQFYTRWNKMAQDSRQPQQEEGGNIWEDAIRSLGLRANQSGSGLRGNRSGVRDDRPITESIRVLPPASLRNRFQGYNEGIGR